MLDFTISQYIVGENKEQDEKYRLDCFEKIKNTNKPITLSYVGGYNNWMAIYEHKQISLEELKELIESKSFGYFVIEKENGILLKRIESYM